MSRITVPFYFGLGSRYSYLAATQLDRIETTTCAQFEWLPLQSGELIRRANDNRSPFDGNHSFGQYDWAYRRRDAEAWAAYYGIAYKEPAPIDIDPSDLANACWAADFDGQLKAMSRRLFHAIFVEGVTISRDVLGALASELGMIGQELIDALDTPSVSARHEDALQRALKDGAFGVPSFNLAGQVFWGNDRLPLLEHALVQTMPSNEA